MSFTFNFATSTHDVVQSKAADCTPLEGGLVYPSSGSLAATGESTTFTVGESTAYFFCTPHCGGGMKFVAKVAGNGTAPSGAEPKATPSNSAAGNVVSASLVALGFLLI